MAVSTVGVVGAGQMGSGIAQVTAQAGVRVVMNDVSQEMCSHGLDAIGRNLDRMVQRGRFKPEERDRVIARIETTTNLEDLASADFVIEAVVENEDARSDCFRSSTSCARPR
jgi:3-hydroxybutyryl-CoA dehydrogenase